MNRGRNRAESSVDKKDLSTVENYSYNSNMKVEIRKRDDNRRKNIIVKRVSAMMRVDFFNSEVKLSNLVLS